MVIKKIIKLILEVILLCILAVIGVVNAFVLMWIARKIESKNLTMIGKLALVIFVAGAFLSGAGIEESGMLLFLGAALPALPIWLALPSYRKKMSQFFTEDEVELEKKMVLQFETVRGEISNTAEDVKNKRLQVRSIKKERKKIKKEEKTRKATERKKKCPICGQEIGFVKAKVLDGQICMDCNNQFFKITQYKRGLVDIQKMFAVLEIEKILHHEITFFPNIETFECHCMLETRHIVIDYFHQEVYKLGNMSRSRVEKIKFCNIVSCDLIEDGKNYGGFGKKIGMAAVGGVLFGGAGAVVGALVSGDSKRKTTDLSINVYYKNESGNGSISKYVLPIISVPNSEALKCNSANYKSYAERVRIILRHLEEIIRNNS